MRFLEKIKKIFRKNEMDESMKQQHPEKNNPEQSGRGQRLLSEKSIVDLMNSLEVTSENAYSCAEAYALFEEYVELVVSDEDAALLMPLVKNHVDMCPDCTEHYQILLNILKSEPDDMDISGQ